MHAALGPLVVVISAVLSASQSAWHPLLGAEVLLLERQFILSPLCSRMFSLSAKPHTWHCCPHLVPPFSNGLWKTDPLCVSCSSASWLWLHLPPAPTHLGRLEAETSPSSEVSAGEGGKKKVSNIFLFFKM